MMPYKKCLITHNVVGRDRLAIHNDGGNNWLDVYDGRLFEWFMQYDDVVGGDEWLHQINSAKVTADKDKILCAAHYGKTTEDRMYGLASFLLISGDKSYYFFEEGGVDTSSDLAWYKEYEAKIGKPSGDYYKKDGVYQRDFTNDKVLVNPNDSMFAKTINIKLDKNYKTLEGEIVTEIALKPKTGIILLKE